MNPRTNLEDKKNIHVNCNTYDISPPLYNLQSPSSAYLIESLPPPSTLNVESMEIPIIPAQIFYPQFYPSLNSMVLNLDSPQIDSTHNNSSIPPCVPLTPLPSHLPTDLPYLHLLFQIPLIYIFLNPLQSVALLSKKRCHERGYLVGKRSKPDPSLLDISTCLNQLSLSLHPK